MATEFKPVNLVDKDGVPYVARTASEEAHMRGNLGYRSAPTDKKTPATKPGPNPS